MPKGIYPRNAPVWNKGLKGYRVGEKRKPHTDKAKKKMSDTRKGKIHTEKTKNKIRGRIPWNKGTHCMTTTSFKKGHSLNIGRVPWNKGKKTGISGMKGKHHTIESIKKVSGENSPNWRGGLSFEPYCHKFNNQLKKRIRDRDNHTCRLCGEKENGHKLDVHHIHYDRPNCDPDLITLCRKCNARVNGNRNYFEMLFMNMLKRQGVEI